MAFGVAAKIRLSIALSAGMLRGGQRSVHQMFQLLWHETSGLGIELEQVDPCRWITLLGSRFVIAASTLRVAVNAAPKVGRLTQLVLRKREGLRRGHA